MPRIKITDDEHRLIERHREQVRSFNQGVAAALAILKEWEGNLVRKDGLDKLEWDSLLQDVSKGFKETL